MGKNQISKTKGTAKCSRMYPLLHQDVANAVSEHISVLQFHGIDSDERVSKDYSTYATGVFQCYSHACSTSAWSSGKVTILVRKYWDGAYNAVVFKQRCEACDKLETLKIDETTYIDRVAYRLLKARKTSPHKAHLCEGCKRGICRDANI
ncbi:hypothetical protein EJ07DRAFT_168291 [Lizonia empirigonia]|nr:hypothetical protein EJ07DRAFT_168291 [Lizonia empirigonia]